MNTAKVQPIKYLKSAVLIIALIVSNFLYSQNIIVNYNFNDSDENWTTTSGWACGNSADSKFNGSDGNYWHLDPFDNYDNSMNVVVTSPVIDLSNYGYLTLEIAIAYKTEARWDGFHIEYFDGSNWKTLGAVGSGTNWYNDDDVDAIDNHVHGWSGTQSSWLNAEISLPADLEDNSNAQFRVRFASDRNIAKDGVAFDNFTVSGYYTQAIVNYTFNDSNNNWTAGSGWTHGNSADHKFSGSDGNYWHISPFDNYSNNMEAIVTSDIIDLSGKENMALMCDVRYNTRNDDGFNIEYFDGTNWSILGSYGSGTNWYNDSDIDGIANNADGWTGDNATWQTATIELPEILENNADVQFRIKFGSNNGSTDDGVAFDNFRITEFSENPPIPPKTWYAYTGSGNWNEPSSWTTDPAINPLFINPNHEIPGENDQVVIAPGKKITIQANTNNLTVSRIEINGKLDVTQSTGHNFNQISGNGWIQLAGNNNGTFIEDNFPEGNNTHFIDSVYGGSVEIYGSGLVLNKEYTFNNLKINLESGELILLKKLTLNGDLHIQKGTFKINDNSSMQTIQIIAYGNILVESGGALKVGTANATNEQMASGYGNYHKYFHTLKLFGNFTNLGTVRLTNLETPNYSSRATNGVVSLIFSGNKNQLFNCQNSTDIYYLVVDKGSNSNYELTINATDKSYFSLYGDNNNDWDFTDTSNPENKKALWIKSGTLTLQGHVYIPTLTEGARDYVIGENAALKINGDNVFVSITNLSSEDGVHQAINYSGLSYNSSTGLNNNDAVQGMYIFGQLIVNKGELRTSNSHGLVYRAESPAARIEINGGTVVASQLRVSSNASNDNAKLNYIQTGGELYLVDNKTNAAIFDLNAALGGFNMSGGSITINDLSEGESNALEIICPDNNTQVSGGTIIIDNSAGTNAVATIKTSAPIHNLILRDNQNNGIKLLSELHIKNDLIIESETFNANNFDIYIASDLNVAVAGSFNTGTNTLYFNGTKQSNLYLPSLQTFHNIVVNKQVAFKKLKISSAPINAFTVNGTFDFKNGLFDLGEYLVKLKGNVLVKDTIGIADNTGKIILNGDQAQSITSENGIFSNIEIDNPHGISLLGDLGIRGALTLTQGVFDIKSYKLTMADTSATITGSFSANTMIATQGKASDGGVNYYVHANDTLIFPIGTNESAGIRYSPATVILSNVTDDGYLKISMGDAQIPMTLNNGTQTASFYWKTDFSDFETLPSINSYTFKFDASDLPANTDNFHAAKVLSIDPYTQSTENGNFNSNTKEVVFNAGFSIEKASYTAGEANVFTGSPDIYYSRKWGNFNDPSVWSKNDSTGNGNQEIPNSGSIIVIQNSNRVNVHSAIPTLAMVDFKHNYDSFPDAGSENVPRLQFHASGNFNIGEVKGTGMISFNTLNNPNVNGDFGNFGTNSDSYMLYFGGDKTLSNIPEPIPNLMFEVSTYQINQAIKTYGDLIIQGDGKLVLKKDSEVLGNVLLGNWLGGTLELPSQNNEVILTVYGDIDFSRNPLNNLGNRNLIVQHQSTNNVAHKIIVHGDILHGSANSTFDLWNSNTTERAILEFQGASHNNYSRSSNAVPELYQLLMNKGIDTTYGFTFNNHIILNGPTNSSDNRSIELINGKLIFNSNDFNINLTTANALSIPSSAGLVLQNGTFKAKGNSGGILLDGLLVLSGATLNMNDSNEDNCIAYGSSGNATIRITGGTLRVGTQIRRLETNNSGILSYKQTNGDVIIGSNSNLAKYKNNRGLLEVLNSGSEFTFTGGALTFVHQNGTNPTTAALLLNPDLSQISGTINIGDENTPDTESLKINSTVALSNISVHCNSGLLVNPLDISGDLSLDQKAEFNANGLDLNIMGSFENNGTYIANGNTLTFNLTTEQSWSGSGEEDLYRLTKTGTEQLILSKNITVKNRLTIADGILNTNNYTLTAKGNVIHNGQIISNSGLGLVFLGTNEQLLNRATPGKSYIDILTINNRKGVKISEIDHAFTINKALRLESGVFNIAGNLLELSTEAEIEDIKPFSAQNMIQTNSSFQDNGLKKSFSSNHASDFIFPIGQNTYSPVSFDFSSSGNTSGISAGSITIRPAHEFHPVINDGSDYFASGDINNVLHYYWIIKAENLNGFKSDVTLIYNDDDVHIDEAAYAEDAYIPARILSINNPSEFINKFSPADIDANNNTITFNFNNVTENNISGDYFAGIDEAIPNNVQIYTTSGGGNITASSSFDELLPTDGVAPAGAILIVDTDDEIIFNVDNVSLYKTEIKEGATLTIDQTNQHRLGTVTGNGTIKIISNNQNVSFPAGDYLDFFTCEGGNLEYSGAGSYSILGGLTTIKNVVLSGSGSKELANNHVFICENFNVNGPDFMNSSNKNIQVDGNLILSSGSFHSGINNQILVQGSLLVNGGLYHGESGGTDIFNELNINNGTFDIGSAGSITLTGDLNYTNGNFLGGSGTSKLILNGSALQTLNGEFSDNAHIHNLEINNSSGIKLNGATEIYNSLELKSGVITTNNYALILGSDAFVYPEKGSETSFVNGKLSKVLSNAGDGFIFPVGKNGLLGVAGVHNVSTAGLTWDIEYFPTSAMSESSVTNMNASDALEIVSISKSEYWKISDNGSSNATITLSWNSNSTVSADQTEREKLKVLKWNGASWDNYGGGTFSAGHSQQFGTFMSTSLVSFSEQILTLGSGDESNPLPVELIYFAANSNIENIELLWGTATEKNNDYFEVQRADDAITFYTIGRVNGFGNSTTQIDYSFIDDIPIDGISYYRLKQVDFDGKFTYHKTIKVDWEQFAMGEDDEIQIYPNPYISGDLSLVLSDLEPYTSITIRITDFNGNVKYNFSLNVPDSKKLNLIPMAMDNLTKGIYFLTVTTSRNQFIKKIIVE